MWSTPQIPPLTSTGFTPSTFLELVQSEAAGVLRKSWIIVKDFSDAGAVLINDMELDPSAHSESISVINLMYKHLKTQVANLVVAKAVLRPLKPKEVRREVVESARQIAVNLDAELSSHVDLLASNVLVPIDI